MPPRKPAVRKSAGAARPGPLPVPGPTLAHDSPFPLVVLTEAGAVKFLNPAAEARFPGLRERGRGHHLVANVLAVAATMPKSKRVLDREAMYGERVYAERIVRESGLLTVHLNDVSELHDVREDFKILQTHDTLTELSNRSHFLDQLATAVHAALRYKYPLALVICDVDGMRRINDQLGQKAGDHVLAEIGKILKTCLRREDFAGRYGGDEFAVVFPHSTAQDAVIGVERIRRRIAALHLSQGPATIGSVTVSCGMADLAPGDTGDKQLLAAASASLAAAREDVTPRR